MVRSLGQRRRLPAEHVGAIVDEALVLDQPRRPLRAAGEVGGLDRPLPVRHRVRRIGDVAVVAGRAGGGRRIHAEHLVGAEVEADRLRLLGRRPLAPAPPLVGAGLEGERFGEVARALVLQEEGEERRLHLVAEVGRRVAAERDRAERRAVAGPAAVVPRADDQVVQAAGVVLLERLVDVERAVEVLLVPPAGDVQRRHLHPADVGDERLPLPELVVVGMAHEVVPGRDRSRRKRRFTALSGPSVRYQS